MTTKKNKNQLKNKSQAVKRLLMLSVLCLTLIIINTNILNAGVINKVWTFENGTIPQDFTNTAQYPFKIIAQGYNSNYAISNYNITDNQHSKISLNNVTLADSNISFMYKISSEQGYDYFNFYINGVKVFSDTGIKDWSLYTHHITAGVYNLTWEYQKDASVSQGTDSVLIDNINLTLIDNISSTDPLNYNIINDYSPLNTSPTKPELHINLKFPASCELYINDIKVYSFSNLMSDVYSFITTKNFSYYWYCYGFYNVSKVYDKTPITRINVLNPINTLTFKIIGKDYNVSDETLYIATPCPVEGYSAIGYKVGYQPKYNPNGIYWKPLTSDGTATFNLTSGMHNFCLFNGQVVINKKGQTTAYYVTQKKGLLNLGNFTIPNSNNAVYIIKTSKFEIYDKTLPEAYGKTWVSLIPSLLAFFLGILLLYAGIEFNNSKLMIIGGLITLTSLGLSIKGLIAVIT